MRDGLSPGALGLAMLASVVGTVLIAKLGKSQGATLAGAAVSPMIAALFTTRRQGLVGRLRAGAVALLTFAAAGFTVLGFTATESATGESLINDDQSTTFPVPDANTNNGTDTPSTPTPGTDPPEVAAIEVTLDGAVPAEPVRICAGGAVDLDAEVTNSDGSTDFDPDVGWSPDDESIAIVDDDGVVTASSEVTTITSTNITARLDDDTSDSVLVEVVFC